MANFIHKINFGSRLTVVGEPQNFESATAAITSAVPSSPAIDMKGP